MSEVQIRDYHAHVYYRDPVEREKAERVRERVSERFTVELGRWRDEPVGPHSHPMYQVKFTPEAFANVVPWRSLHHEGLSVLIHPETGDDLLDHTEHALWLGDQFELALAVFE